MLKTVVLPKHIVNRIPRDVNRKHLIFVVTLNFILVCIDRHNFDAFHIIFVTHLFSMNIHPVHS